MSLSIREVPQGGFTPFQRLLSDSSKKHVSLTLSSVSQGIRIQFPEGDTPLKRQKIASEKIEESKQLDLEKTDYTDQAPLSEDWETLLFPTELESEDLIFNFDP